MALAALEPIFWRAFCVHAECPDLIDFQFDSAAIARTAEVFRLRTRAAWVEFSQRVDCCMEPLLDVTETLEHPQVKARNLIQTEGRVPRLGEDTAVVLRTLGIADSELEELFQSKIIGA
jgi:crotonobetainyl-CoA:carnitine CoA-transferase CaiB-like acyl-CoA transferase